MRHNLLILLSLLLLTLGCANSRVSPRLDAAEAIMEQHPDSALTILQQIDGSALSGETRARHALLLSQALDKNYVDVTSDSLISIAVNYYATHHNNKHNKMWAAYYEVVILMNRQDYDEALSKAFDVVKLAEEMGDLTCLTQTKHLIARAYLFTYNQEGAADYFNQTLQLARELNKQNWIGAIFLNLTNLSLQQKDFLRAAQYADSVKSYIPQHHDLPEYEMFMNIGMENYELADSIYKNRICHNSPSLQARTYKLLIDYKLGKPINFEDSLSILQQNATHDDSIDVAWVATSIYQLRGDYYKALHYNNKLLDESNHVIKNLSNHSLYRIQLEHNKRENLEQAHALRNKTHFTIFIIIVSALTIALSATYLYFMRSRHKHQIAELKNDFILLTAEYARIQENLNSEILQNNSYRIQLNNQILAAQKASQELFTAKYSWIEELGNILLDSEASVSTANRALRDIKKKFENVRNKQFISDAISLINKYRSNLIGRIRSECPSITDAELNILTLLCAGLSPRIISFILAIKPQSIYNAKSSIKRKLTAQNSRIIEEMTDIFN